MAPPVGRSPAHLFVGLCLLLGCFPCNPITALHKPTQNTIAPYIQMLRNNVPVTVAGERLVSQTVLSALYQQHDYMPLWSNLRSIEQLFNAIRRSSEEGLVPADYHLITLQALQRRLIEIGVSAQPRLAIDFDLMLTDSLIRLAYHLNIGKVDPETLDPDWNIQRHIIDGDAVRRLGEAIQDGRINTLLNSLRPIFPLYTRLQSALRKYRGIAAQGGWRKVPQGPPLKLGVRDPRVAALRRRLAASSDLMSKDTASNVYDTSLQAAVKHFQRHHGLKMDGVAGRDTLAAMNVSVESRIEQICANLERARWVPHDLPIEFVLVDIAGFNVRFYRNGQVIWNTRAVVGQPIRVTPVFKSRITSMVINPAWTVPPTILEKDVLPAIARNPHFLLENNMRIVDFHDKPVDPTGIDWSRYEDTNFPYMIRQAPGPENPLGRIEFMFPNRYLVYLHDTPDKALFRHTQRAFSSGCIRIEDPFGLADLLLDGDPYWDRERVIAKINNDKTGIIHLRQPVVVILFYWTVDVDKDGTVFFKNDIYDKDPSLIKTLGEPYRFRVMPIGRQALKQIRGAGVGESTN